MGVRLRDRAVHLVPATRTDPRTGEVTADWSKPPASSTSIPFQHQSLTTDEQLLTAETIVTRGRGYLPPWLDGVVTPEHRIRWDGDDYEIDGDVERHKTRTRVRYLTVTLRIVRS